MTKLLKQFILIIIFIILFINLFCANTNVKVENDYSLKISRTELKTKFNEENIDSTLQGVRAGPYRIDGKIIGYKLYSVATYSYLYKLGFYSEDIVLRINGHPIDGIKNLEKLYDIWKNNIEKNYKRIVIDVLRNNKMISLIFNIFE